ASAIIVPMSLLIIVESLIMIQPGERGALWFVVIAMVVVVVLLTRTGTHIFRREELLGRSVDHINLSWAGRIFLEQWSGGVKRLSPVVWYKQSILPAVWGLRHAMLAYVVLAIFMFAFGWVMRETYPLPLDAANLSNEEILQNSREIFEGGLLDGEFVAFAVIQNSRVIFLALFIGMFTFGVVGLVLTSLPFGILGYVFANVAQSQLSPLIFLAAVVPHGIIEIPAIMLAGAAALQLGAVPTRKPSKMTVSEAFIRQLADTIKVAVFVIFPMLVIAAFLEVYLTPVVIEQILTTL
ncbi:MAG: stage II sporulation protein M, partial [Anaerolineales bacterium]